MECLLFWKCLKVGFFTNRVGFFNFSFTKFPCLFRCTPCHTKTVPENLNQYFKALTPRIQCIFFPKPLFQSVSQPVSSMGIMVGSHGRVLWKNSAASNLLTSLVGCDRYSSKITLYQSSHKADSAIRPQTLGSHLRINAREGAD
jgi:hypothetical protein